MLAEQRFRELPAELATLTEVTSLTLVDLPELERAEGLEKLVGLETLALRLVAPAALPDLFERVAQLPGLTQLVVDAETAAHLPAAFDRLHGLLALELRGAAKVALGPLFARLGALEGLRVLSLHGDRADGVVTLPPTTAALVRLRELRIEAPCPVLAEPVTSLAALETLAVAPPILQRHAIKVLPAALGRLSALRALRLRGHRVAALPDSLCDLAELQVLDLCGCLFDRLPARFAALSNLEHLDLSLCKNLTALPEDIGELARLRSLLAGDTAITKLPTSFARLRLSTVELPGDLAAAVSLTPPETLYVEELTLDRPHDRALPDDLGDPRTLEIVMPRLSMPAVAFGALRRLESLSIAPAPAFDLEDALRRLASAPNLKRLYLHDWKHLTTLPATIGGLLHLQTLELRGSGLTTLPAAIGALGALLRLDLSGSPLRSLPEECRGMTALEELELRDIDPLPEGLRHLAALQKLVLSRVTAPSLPAELAALTQLSTLSLVCCRTSDFGVLGELAALRKLETMWHEGAFDPVALFRALARTKIEVLSFRDARHLGELPPELGELRTLRSIDVLSTDVRRFPPETARLTELRTVLFQDFRIKPAELKKVLPAGRWRKETGGRGSSVYRRLD